MADTFTSDTYDALCQEAEGYLARGLSEQARELLLKAASLIGTRPRARSLLADACMSLGLWEEARSQLENLTTLEVDNYHNHFRLGQVLEELSENQLARDNYNVVLDHSPDHHGAKVALNRLEAADDTTNVNLASFFAAGSSSTDSEPEAPSEDTDSGNVVESVFGSTQVFPDAQTDDVFAGEEDIGQGVDKLLKDLGVGGDTQETSGAVSELLSRRRSTSPPSSQLIPHLGVKKSQPERSMRPNQPPPPMPYRTKLPYWSLLLPMLPNPLPRMPNRKMM